MKAGSKRKNAGNDASQDKTDSALFFAGKLKGDDDYDADGFLNDVRMTIGDLCEVAGADEFDAYRFLIDRFKEIVNEA